MSRTLFRQIDRIKAALLSGDAKGALVQIEEWSRQAARTGVDPESRARLETAIDELRELAQSSLNGALLAADQVRAIVQAARSLQTYDSAGRRLVTGTRAILPPFSCRTNCTL